MKNRIILAKWEDFPEIKAINLSENLNFWHKICSILSGNINFENLISFVIYGKIKKTQQPCRYNCFLH